MTVGVVRLADTAQREVREETGIDASHYGLHDWQKQNVYEIYPHWRHRYAPGVTHNTEHVFGLCLPAPQAVTLAPREHLQFAWLPWREAADKVFSWSNAEAIRELPSRFRASPCRASAGPSITTPGKPVSARFRMRSKVPREVTKRSSAPNGS